MLAQIARLEAMAALAEAIGEEQRTTALAERSRMLLREYSSHPRKDIAVALRDRATFASSLRTIAEQADQARLDARDQAAWHVDTLAAAETRATRIEERREAARRALDAVLEHREQAHAQGVAHKLQSETPTPLEEAETPRPAHRSRTRP